MIGNHVWLGLNTSILKGVRIGNNSAVGNGTILTKNVANNTIVAGNPARRIKENINWDRERI